jgi:hypothetical protein
MDDLQVAFPDYQLSIINHPLLLQNIKEQMPFGFRLSAPYPP